MKHSEPLSEKIINASIETGEIIRMMDTVPGMFDAVAQKWDQACRSIPEQIQSGLLKIAVAGTIKSGKSTFINALVGKDLVQRGAGVVTAVTTRIRKGKKNRARIYLKSWDDINSDIINALLYFPQLESQQKVIEQFDIRRQKDREFLQSAYEKMITLFSANDGSLSSGIKVIQYALQGFDACMDAVRADDAVLEFTGRQFDLHKGYSADLSRAFFVKDIQLDIFTSELDTQVEIADCQGSDSTDPGQAIHIQNYLESAHLIVYLISSRTGLRQADIQILTRIRQMGLSGQILFVNNVDLSEHDHLKDLKKVEQDIIRELKYVIEAPVLFSFSSLFLLFSNIDSRLVSRDKKRLVLWQEEKQLVDYCQKMEQEFKRQLNLRLEKDRFRMLLANPLERLSLIVHSGIQKTRLFSGMFSDNSQKALEAIEQLKNAEENILKLESIMDHFLSGATEEILHKIKSETGQLFSPETGRIIKEIEQFIHHYSFVMVSNQKPMDLSGVHTAVYIMFQNFRSALELFTAQQIQPVLIGFVNTMEKEIESYFKSVLVSSLIDLPDHSINDPSGAIRDRDNFQRIPMEIDLSAIKKILGLSIPIIRINFRYSAKIKVTTLADYSLGSLLTIASALFKGRKARYNASGLDHAAERIKRQGLKLLPVQMETFRDDLISGFFNPLVSAVTRDLKEKISQVYRLFDDRTRMSQALHEQKQAFNKEQIDCLEAIADRLNKIRITLDGVSLKYPV